MIKKINRIHILLFSSILLVLLAGSIIFIKRDFLIQAGEGIFKRQVISGSKANLLTEGSRLKISFDIKDEERGDVKAFSESLGVSEEYLKGIELELDSKSMETLAEITPMEVNLDFSESGVKFYNKNLKGLKSGVIKSDVHIATLEGEFDLKASSGSDFKLNIKRPMVVLEQATGSGSLSLSKKLTPVFPILERVDTIEIEVYGKNVNGEIKVKN